MAALAQVKKKKKKKDECLNQEGREKGQITEKFQNSKINRLCRHVFAKGTYLPALY